MTGLDKLMRPSSVLALTLALLVLGSLSQRAFGHYTNRDVDFFVYYFAAQSVHDSPKSGLLYDGDLNGNPELKNAPIGTELYKKAGAAGVGEVMLYLYPPLLADTLVPISRLPLYSAINFWRIFNLGLVLFSVIVLAKMLRIPLLSVGFAALAAAAYSFFPIYEALAVGQITLVLLALWAIAVVSYSEGAVALSACAIAFATALKITPVLVVPLFFIWKDRRWLAWYAAALASLVLAMGVFNGWHTLEISGKVIAAVGGSIAAMQNKSISSLLAWIYYRRFVPFQGGGGVWENQPHLLVLTEKVVSLGFFLVCLFLVWRRRLIQDRMSRVTAMAIFAMVTPLISPLSWRHAYTVALVPLAVLWVQALRTSVSTLHLALLALSTLAMGSLFFDLVAQSHAPRLIQIMSAGLITVSTAALCLETLRHDAIPQNLEASVT
jgi:Glycosyltransferase family 87